MKKSHLVCSIHLDFVPISTIILRTSVQVCLQTVIAVCTIIIIFGFGFRSGLHRGALLTRTMHYRLLWLESYKAAPIFGVR